MKRLLILASLAALVPFGAACSGLSASATSGKSPVKNADLQSDSDVHRWVDDALELDPRIGDTARIDVSVDQGIVKLTGTANDLLEKRYATLETEKIAGVRGVIDEIALAPSDRTDVQVRAEIVRRLTDRPSLHLENLDVNVVDGSVTLRGTVRSLSELKRAELMTSEVQGVRGVINRLDVSYLSPVSDQDNRDQIVAALDLDPYLTGLPITVRVEDGRAILDGTVGNLYERRRAEEDVTRVASVRSVENNLRTDWLRARGTRYGAPHPNDKEIRSAVEDALAQDLRVEHPESIDVTVDKGVVDLQGDVPDTYQKDALESDARNVVGAREVTDLVQVSPGVRKDDLIAGEIRLDLSSDYLLADSDINVDVHRGVATLSGKVDTPYEKQRAAEVARRALGVRDVVNDVTVPSQAGYTDAALVQHIDSRLRSDWETRDVAGEIHVKVEDGVATLEGKVDTWPESMEAVRVARDVEGVQQVQNHLVVSVG